jgi:hypothetical protein
MTLPIVIDGGFATYSCQQSRYDNAVMKEFILHDDSAVNMIV